MVKCSNTVLKVVTKLAVLSLKRIILFSKLISHVVPVRKESKFFTYAKIGFCFFEKSIYDSNMQFPENINYRNVSRK